MLCMGENIHRGLRRKLYVMKQRLGDSNHNEAQPPQDAARGSKHSYTHDGEGKPTCRGCVGADNTFSTSPRTLHLLPTITNTTTNNVNIPYPPAHHPNTTTTKLPLSPASSTHPPPPLSTSSLHSLHPNPPPSPVSIPQYPSNHQTITVNISLHLPITYPVPTPPPDIIIAGKC